MQLLTATDLQTGELAGLVFWRNLPKVEMEEWMLGGANKRVKKEDGAVAVQAIVDGKEVIRQQTDRGHATEGWVKIEVMGTADCCRGNGIGKLLLAGALVFAVARQGKKHALLQVAGGGDNVRAESLYKAFGFECPPEGYFGCPNDHLRVVWNIGKSLRRLMGAPASPIQAVAPAEAQAALPAPKAEDPHDALCKLSVGELKRRLDECGVSISGCIEKRDLACRLHKLIQSPEES